MKFIENKTPQILAALKSSLRLFRRPIQTPTRFGICETSVGNVTVNVARLIIKHLSFHISYNLSPEDVPV